jgi:hypothetical protein
VIYLLIVSCVKSSLSYYRYFETMSDTFLFIAKERLEDRWTSRIYDEVQTSQKVTRQSSHAYETQKDIWALERKLGSMTTAILQLQRWIPPELYEFADVFVHKPTVEDKSLVDIYRVGERREYYKGVRHPEVRLAEIEDLGIEPPRLDSYSFGLLVVDFVYRKLYDHVTEGLKDPEWHKCDELISHKQLELVIDFLEGLKRGELTRIELTPDHIALAIREIHRVKEWRRPRCAEVWGGVFREGRNHWKNIGLPSSLTGKKICLDQSNSSD